jgi:asparagine synthase (glutamine-hydrolysing)
MCGIWALLGKPLDQSVVKYYLKNLTNRGPEDAKLVEESNYQLGFTRLAINGLNINGMQPMKDPSGRFIWICNGEIYNWKELASKYNIKINSGSDCEIIGELFNKIGFETDAKTFFRSLDGVFSMIIIDTQLEIAYVARDPYGVRPLFISYIQASNSNTINTDQAFILDAGGNKVYIENIIFSSELKGIPLSQCIMTESFTPGFCGAYNLKNLQRIGFEPYHTVPWIKNQSLSNKASAALAIRDALTAAVKKRMMTQRPVAALLSGGLDSSLIAALVQRELKLVGAPSLKTFSIGFEGSQDLKYAKLVANHIGSEHYEIIMTHDDFLDAIPAVIRDIESYDITTVRASVGNWLISREIRRRTDCKVVFNGDGSDEVFGGYLYFYNAPNDEAFEAESEKLLEHIHYFDVLRSDRSISSHGLEARTPFLDKQFVAVARSVATTLRRPKKGLQEEKMILREAFKDTDLLPTEVLMRKKEAFSDGVSGEKSWYEICKEYAEKEVPSDWMEQANAITHLRPTTAEGFYYRSIFNKFYNSQCDTATVPYYWMPKWSPNATDPSARTLEVYKN